MSINWKQIEIKVICRKNKGVYLYTLPICKLLVILTIELGTKPKPRQSTFTEWYGMQMI